MREMCLNRVARTLVNELDTGVRLEITTEMFEHLDVMAFRLVHASRDSSNRKADIGSTGDGHVDEGTDDARVVVMNIFL